MSPPSAELGAALVDALRAVVREAVEAALANVPPPLKTPAVRLLSKAELADALGVSSAKVDRLCRAGAIPFIRVGDVRRFDLAAVLDVLEKSVPVAPRSTSPSSMPARAVVRGVRLLSRGSR